LARKILLADDSVTAQNMGRKILADAGYEVIAVNNGSAALKKIAETKPDIIILDVYMPGYSGLEVCQRVKEAQETARIPVLLSVGKLEPFKPEEARRVRAEGYIVKPFEASELLSALSKLEDKIVPRPELSKPGRFARANAAIDQGKNEAKHEGRYDKSVATDEDSGWKDRIGFPSKNKKPADGAYDDDSTIYNAVNKDLRTVVDRKLAQESREVEAIAAAKSEEAGEEARVDLGALAPEGLPKDVTPEEIAALAAAAAQVKGKLAKEAESDFVPEPARESGREPVKEQTATDADAGQMAQASAAESRPVDDRRSADEQAAEATKKESQAGAESPKESTFAAAATFAAQKEQEASEASPDKAEEHGHNSNLAAPIPLALSPLEPSAREMLAALAGLIPEKGKSADSNGGNGPESHGGIYSPASSTYAAHDIEPGLEIEERRDVHRRGTDSPAGNPATSEPVTMAAAAGATFGGSTGRWTAVAVAPAAGETTVSLELEMQKAHAAFAAAEVAHARFAATPAEPMGSIAESVSAQSVSAESVLAESVLAQPVVAEPVVCEPASPAQTSSSSSSSSLTLSGPPVESASELETGTASETAIPAGPVASAGTVAEESAPPAAASEAIAATVKEFEKVGASNFGSRDEAFAAQEVAAPQAAETAAQTPAEILPSQVSPSSETKSQDIGEAVSLAHHAEPVAATVEVAKESTPEPAQERKQIGEEVGEVRQAEVREQFMPAELKHAEPVAETVALVAAAKESPGKIGDTSDSNSPEPAGESTSNQAAQPGFTRADVFEATAPAAGCEPAVGGIKDMAKKESEISETTAAAWANWRRIRESGDGKSAAAQAAAPKPPEAEPISANPGAEKDHAQPEAARAVAAGAETSPEASLEEGSAAAADDSGEIASMVDSVMAQMRPRIVEEISRKLGKKK
jgi:CheY-like chemotaxis protein